MQAFSEMGSPDQGLSPCYNEVENHQFMSNISILIRRKNVKETSSRALDVQRGEKRNLSDITGLQPESLCSFLG